MRQGQQNRRGRGRNNNHNNNNNNRKNQNPLTRSFESAGPDVKIRGTPSHIAEKYVSLARDAQSSGDPVLAENYLQHAEHYNRIILTFREQQVSQGGDPFAGGTLARTHSLNPHDNPDGEDFSDDEAASAPDDGSGAQPPMSGDGNQPPPQFQPPQPQQFQGNRPERPYDNNPRYDNRQNRHDNNRGDYRNNNHRQDRGDHQRFDRNDRGDRQDFRGDRGNYDRGSNDRGYRDNRGFQNNQGDGQGDGNGYRRRDRYQNQGGNGFERDAQPPPGFQPQSPPSSPSPPSPPSVPVEQEQPAFLRRPVRRPRNSEAAPQAAAPPVPSEGSEE